MCTYPVQPICTFSCTSVFILIFINPQYTVLHILSHCTSYSLFYFIICSYFHSHLYLYIFSCVMFHCFIYILFYFIYIFLHFPLSGPVLTYISLLIIPCMIVYVMNNKEPWTWTLNLKASVDMSSSISIWMALQQKQVKRSPYLLYDLRLWRVGRGRELWERSEAGGVNGNERHLRHSPVSSPTEELRKG